MLYISDVMTLPLSELKFSFIASPGPGGQNVNKTATTAQLRFNVMLSPSLPEDVRQRLIVYVGKKLTSQGELIIKANRYRTQLQNKQDAIDRLCAILQKVSTKPRRRKKTKPTLASKQRRLTKKKQQGMKKAMRHKKSQFE